MQKRNNPLALKSDTPSRPLTRRVSPFDEPKKPVEEITLSTLEVETPEPPAAPVEEPRATVVEPAPVSEPEEEVTADPANAYGWQFVAPKAEDPQEDELVVEDKIEDDVSSVEMLDTETLDIALPEPEPVADGTSMEDPIGIEPEQEPVMNTLTELAVEPETADPADDYVLPDMTDEPFDDRPETVEEAVPVDDEPLCDDEPVYADEPAPMPVTPTVADEKAEDEALTEEPDPVSYTAEDDMLSDAEQEEEADEARGAYVDDEMTVADYKLAARFSLCGNISRKMKTVKVSSDVGRLAQLMHPDESLSTIVENALLSRIYVENRDAFDALAEMIEKKGGHIKC